MNDFVFISTFHGTAKGWYVRAVDLSHVFIVLGLDACCCEFAAIPKLLQSFLQSYYDESVTIVPLDGGKVTELVICRSVHREGKPDDKDQGRS